MSFLSMVEAKLPPGFRFHPRDDELVCDYLAVKVACGGGGGVANFYGWPMMVDVDLNKCEPWDLPATACVAGKEWYFFSLRDRKYATGQRTNRATASGYWKATGKDRPISRKGVAVGMRKTLVFYQGRAPKGKKTEWVMHEFRMEGPNHSSSSSSTTATTTAAVANLPFKEDWVLCRVFYKSRDITSRPRMETIYDESGPNSSLPPLMDNNYITFDQTPMNLEGFEQVPCFSSLAPSHAPQGPMMGSQPHLPPAERSLPLPKSLDQFGELPDLGPGFNQHTSDKVLKTVLSHLTKMEANPKGEMVAPDLDEEGFSAFLTQSSSAWHHHDMSFDL